MPSIYSDQLKQAIIYIGAGELEIAKEIILEIIQNDPDYEKAWIWLLETVPDSSGKVDILKTRFEQYPDSSPLTCRALKQLSPETLNQVKQGKQSAATPPPSTPPEITAFEEDLFDAEIDESLYFEDDVIEDEAPIQYEVNSEDIIRDRLGLDENDEDELFDTSPAFEESSSADEEFVGTDNFEDLFEDPSYDRHMSTAELGRNLMLEPVDDEDLFEQDLEDFLQNDTEDSFLTEESGTEAPTLADEDLSDFESWLASDEDERVEDEEDEFSALLSQGFDRKEPEKTTSTSQSNPFVLSADESLDIFGDEPLEDTKPQSSSTSQSQSVFSEEGLRELGIDNEEMEIQFDLDDATVFPISDGVTAEPVSADDLLYLSNDLRAEVMGKETAKSPSKKLETSKDLKKSKKKKNNNQTFLFGCSIIAAILILTLVGIGYIFWQNWSTRPPEPTATTVPTLEATPTEEYILEAPWLEETPTPLPTDTDQ